MNREYSGTWGDAKLQSGYTCLEKVLGGESKERGKDIEQVIEDFNDALKAYNTGAFQEKWAMTQYLLAIAYIEREYEDKIGNLNTAITALHNALDVFKRGKHSELWADIQSGLGIAYRDLADAYRNSTHTDEAGLELVFHPGIVHFKELREQSFECFRKAADIFKSERILEKWAKVQLNMGNTYLKPVRENGDVGRAIKCFEAALQVFNPETYPKEYAAVQIGLGNASVLS